MRKTLSDGFSLPLPYVSSGTLKAHDYPYLNLHLAGNLQVRSGPSVKVGSLALLCYVFQ